MVSCIFVRWNKMLIAAGSGNPPTNLADIGTNHCRFRLAAAQNIATGGPPKLVLLDTTSPTEDPFGIANLVTHQIVLPANARQVQVIGHISAAPQALATAGEWSIHLFRNGLPTIDLYYHNRAYMPAVLVGSYLSLESVTPWMKVQSVGETWDLRILQNTGQPLTAYNDGNAEDCWLSANWV